MIVKVDACQCEYNACKHIWLPEKGKGFPKRCARCKKANWHNRPIIIKSGLSTGGAAGTQCENPKTRDRAAGKQSARSAQSTHSSANSGGAGDSQPEEVVDAPANKFDETSG